MSKKLLVINLGMEQQPLIEALLKRDMILFGIHHDDEYMRHSGFKAVEVCAYDELTKIYAFAKKNGIEAVITDNCDYSLYTAGYLCGYLGIHTFSLHASLVANNKLLQRRMMQEAGFPTPPFAHCYTLEEARRFETYPAIVKPLDNRGSIGVVKVRSRAELDEAFFTALAHSRSKSVIIEAIIDGREYTVDGYCFDGRPTTLAIASKQHLNPDQPVAMHIVYSDLDDVLYTKLKAVNEQVNTVLGYDFGMIHSEYIVDASGEIFLVESTNRGGGVFTSEIIVPEVSGIDLLNRYIDDALGIKSPIGCKTVEKNNLCLHFFSFPPGKIKQIDKDQFKDPRIVKWMLFVNEGEEITPITSDANRHGFIIVKTDSKEGMAQFFDRFSPKVVYESV